MVASIPIRYFSTRLEKLGELVRTEAVGEE